MDIMEAIIANVYAYSGTSLIRAVWDQGVPVTLKLPVTLNLFVNYVRTTHMAI